jgi:hypothetical protein
LEIVFGCSSAEEKMLEFCAGTLSWRGIAGGTEGLANEAEFGMGSEMRNDTIGDDYSG